MLLISGANGPLGRCLVSRLLSRGIRVKQLSSSPTKEQVKYSFGDLSALKTLRLNGATLIHCARSTKFTEEQLIKEKNDLEFLIENGTTIINIASVSGYLANPNAYGQYKKSIEEWLRKKNQQNLISGLLFAKDFGGQIKKIKDVLKVLPFCPQISGSGEIFLTPVDWIEESIIFSLARKSNTNESHGLITKPRMFNWLLRELAGPRKPKLSISLANLMLMFRFLPKNRYFSQDSLQGISGDYQGLNSVGLTQQKDFELLHLWEEFIAS
jgi:hypothetical protein